MDELVDARPGAGRRAATRSADAAGGIGRRPRPRAGARRRSTTPRSRRAGGRDAGRWRSAAAPFAAARTSRSSARFKLPAVPDHHHRLVPADRGVRKARAAHAKGALERRRLRDASCKEEIARAVRWQEEIGLDVLVHGESERNDMVQYFGEQLDGFAFTQHGWVQSYGSRCVRPPILFGDVSRPKPMTVGWSRYAQSLTDKADEGHADRPGDDPQLVVRARRPAAQATCRQIALAIRDEVARSGEGRHRDHPDRRAGPARRPAAAPGRLDRPISTGRSSASACAAAGVARRNADPHPHVLLGVQRHHRRDRRDGCRRDHDRDLALEDGAARRLHRPTAIRTRSAPASTTSTRRGCRRSRR